MELDVLSRLPLEITQEVFLHLNDYDLLKAKKVCGRWAKMMHIDYFWRKKFCDINNSPAIDDASENRKKFMAKFEMKHEAQFMATMIRRRNWLKKELDVTPPLFVKANIRSKYYWENIYAGENIIILICQCKLKILDPSTKEILHVLRGNFLRFDTIKVHRQYIWISDRNRVFVFDIHLGRIRWFKKYKSRLFHVWSFVSFYENLFACNLAADWIWSIGDIQTGILKCTISMDDDAFIYGKLWNGNLITLAYNNCLVKIFDTANYQNIYSRPIGSGLSLADDPMLVENKYLIGRTLKIMDQEVIFVWCLHTRTVLHTFQRSTDRWGHIIGSKFLSLSNNYRILNIKNCMKPGDGYKIETKANIKNYAANSSFIIISTRWTIEFYCIKTGKLLRCISMKKNRSLSIALPPKCSESQVVFEIDVRRGKYIFFWDFDVKV